MTDIRDEAREGFQRIFGYPAHGLWSAPGAVRLIGDHTDYADCHTLTIPLDRRTVVALGVRSDRTIRVASTNANEMAEIRLAELDAEDLSGWPAYPLGVAWAMGRIGVDLGAVPGVDLYIESTVPEGIGLGSSTALTAAVALALADAWQLKTDRIQLARACALAESHAVGEEVGMGPAIAALAHTPDHAALYDARSKDVDQVPLGFAPDEVALVFIACEDHPSPLPPLSARLAALEEVADALDAGSLREVKLTDVEKLRPSASLSAESLARARHVVAENQRVLAAVQHLRESGVTSLGEVFAESHRSVSDAYGIGSPAIDLAVTTAIENGAYAARLLGQRSTGTVLALCPVDEVSRIVQALDGAFSEHALDIPDTVVCQVGTAAVRH